MKIVLSVPGNLKTVPMSNYVTKALRQLNHEVIVFNYQYDNLFQRLYKQISLPRLNEYKNKLLLDLLEKEKPDLFFSIYGLIHSAKVIKKIKSMNIVTASWWLNDPFQLPFDETDAAPEYDFYFSNSRGTQPDYISKGVRIHFLPVGIDPDVHKNLNIKDKKHDIVFMGDHHPIRQQIIENLIKEGFSVAIYGPWKRKIKNNKMLETHVVQEHFFTPEQMVNVFNQSKIVLNINTWLGRWPYGVNPRLFEAAGCGAFQLVDFKTEMKDFFQLGKDMIWFEDKNELPKLISYYLQHDAARNEIAQATLKTAQQHTYVDRMKELLSICGSTKI